MLSEEISSYLIHCKKSRRLSEHSIRAYRADLEQFDGLIGAEPLIAPVVLDSLKRIVEHPTYKAATIKRKISVCRSFIQAIDEQLADEVKRMWKLKLRSATRLPRVISRGNLNSILRSARSKKTGRDGTTYLALSILAATGLRVSELCSVRISDVNAEAGEVRVFGKGSKERVVMVVNERVRLALARHVRWRANTGGPHSPLFCNVRGRPLSSQCLRLRLHKLAREADLSSRITPHMFRHSAATLLLEGGVDIRFVQKLLGHANISTTQIYTYVADKALRTALARADVMKGFA